MGGVRGRLCEHQCHIQTGTENSPHLHKEEYTLIPSSSDKSKAGYDEQEDVMTSINGVCLWARQYLGDKWSRGRDVPMGALCPQ